MSATTVPVPVSGTSSHTQQLPAKEQSAPGHTRSGRKREKTHSANGHNQVEQDLAPQAESSEAKKAKTALPSSPSAVKPSIPDIFKTLEYGPAPEASNVAEAWLDDHKRCPGPTHYMCLLLLHHVLLLGLSDTSSMENGTCQKASGTPTRAGTL